MLYTMDRGILFMLLASLSFAMMGGFAKVVSQVLPPVEVTFFRNIFGVVLVGIAIWKVPLKQRGGKPLLLFFRGFMGFAALLAYFYIMAHIPLGEAVTYNTTSPLFVALFAYLFLHEKLHPSALVAVVIGFMGIILVAQPQGGSFDKYDILGIFSGIGAALAYTSIRELRNYYDTRAIVMSFMLVGTVAPLLLMLMTPYVKVSEEFDWMFAPFVMPQGIEWVYVLAVGVFATISQLLMTKAYELTKAGIVGTISYSNIVFALIIGMMLGDPVPDFWTLLGIILVILSGLLVALPKGIK
ncbi:MAG: EamA family transporter [Sulfurovum sp. 28-43-6]|jgi:drug/metabolite transporter (DMT)-like permease|nr:MAG: EamA family transporter [Sulfurovum sp. 35-42-20]OYY57602.1 MAG: EamA family transporter [Sulfurovum sp. 28-43-6]OYZ24430.1 MAG: EamA family transporter [Sulfurovum sp. 16-42-52]OYZ49701.1 MAG: EamA family transporter [Sulfurovum sp. 24-42-9]OZA44047.1 MAG: EamA family transporter [Sulfurovum sp. 17-42-90]OZA59459.1 MAG: EamA family transporter [Sulfurovum sp. 39-42-12]